MYPMKSGAAAPMNVQFVRKTNITILIILLLRKLVLEYLLSTRLQLHPDGLYMMVII